MVADPPIPRVAVPGKAVAAGRGVVPGRHCRQVEMVVGQVAGAGRQSPR